jgi:hypothetical protein
MRLGLLWARQAALSCVTVQQSKIILKEAWEKPNDKIGERDFGVEAKACDTTFGLPVYCSSLMG